MRAGTAILILTWVAILLLFLAVGALLREIRMMKAQLEAQHEGYAVAAPQIDLGTRLGALAGGERLVLAADPGCPLCLEVADAIASSHPVTRPLLLQYEDGRWPSFVPEHFELVTDPEAWQKIGHLMPPLLMTVSADGQVSDLVAPESGRDAQQIVSRFSSAARA